MRGRKTRSPAGITRFFAVFTRFTRRNAGLKHGLL